MSHDCGPRCDRCFDEFIGWLLAGSLAAPVLFIWAAALLGW